MVLRSDGVAKDLEKPFETVFEEKFKAFIEIWNQHRIIPI